MYWRIVQVFLVAALVIPYSAAAEDDYVFAKLISSDEVIYPLGARVQGWEGWAYYSYSVGTDGRVSDVKILDSNGIGVFNDALISNVQSRVYEPATLNGKEIEQVSTLGRTTFMLNDVPRTAGKKFSRGYKKATSAIIEGELDEAKQLLQKLRQTTRYSLYEELFLQSLYVAYFNSIGESEREYVHAQRVLDFYFQESSSKKRLVEEEYFVPFLAKSYFYELKAMMFGQAFRSALKLSDIVPEEELSMKIVKRAELLLEQVKTKQHSYTGVLNTPVYGGDQGRFSMAILKKELELSDVTGKIDSFAVHCNGGIKAFKYSATVAWTIPRNWGACMFTIEGEVGATFKLTEFPSRAIERT